MTASVAVPNIDLHSHTIHSDGTLTSAELIGLAIDHGVNVLALTDHDTTEGIASAQMAAANSDLTLIPGVEISVTWASRTIHVLGLNIDVTHPLLQQGLAGLRQERNRRADKMIERLQGRGLDGIGAGVKALIGGSIRSRTHFARYLVQAGHAKDIAQAFKRFLKKGAPGYVSGQWAGLEQVVAWIHAAGGQAVIAHPGRYKMGSGRLRQLLADFRDCGGDAIEVHSGHAQSGDSGRLARLCTEFGLLASVGSDYHGPEQQWLTLGKIPPLPPQCTPIWCGWAV